MSTSIAVCSKRRFRFERFWTRLEGFADVVAASWEAGLFVADPLRRLDRKLGKLARDLQRWGSKRVGSIRDQILVTNEVIFRLEAAQDLRPLSFQELTLRRELKKRLLGLASLEHTIARQRARVAALKDGDAATQFFRICATRRKRRNHISRLRDGNRIATDQEGMEDLASAFYAELLGRAQPRVHDLALGAMGLDSVDLAALDAQFTEDEIWAAIKAMPGNKSPGPDGFSWEF
jgi:hypothetical protein